MSNATTRLTKAQLLARIDELEREVTALYVEQRPSRQAPRQEHRSDARIERKQWRDGMGRHYEKTRPVGSHAWTIRELG
jgi:hypothetical protein